MSRSPCGGGSASLIGKVGAWRRLLWFAAERQDGGQFTQAVEQGSDRLYSFVDVDEGGSGKGVTVPRGWCATLRVAGRSRSGARKGNRTNIEAVLAAGLPCVVRCACVDPEAWAMKYGHTHWVPEDVRLRASPSLTRRLKS